MYTVYILFSQSIQKYYVGFTSQSIEARLRRHLSAHKGFTARAKDWKVVFTELVSTKSEAAALEKRIKNRGAKRFLADKSPL